MTPNNIETEVVRRAAVLSWLDQRLRQQLIGLMMPRDICYRSILEGTLRQKFEIATKLSSRDYPPEVQKEETSQAIRVLALRFGCAGELGSHAGINFRG
ncbi:hypothetical protein PG997_002354 [Apiospora hydei]|uniref:Uncharacterized protein n=1 Tax=Apiospora hydei TaxID=1337664 RepID=A0ABR1X969_9PEZI